MKKAVFKLLGLGLLGGLAVTGCCSERSSTSSSKPVLVTPGGQIAVRPPPAAPQAGAVQPPPNKVAYVWVRGYWAYSSSNWGRWVWLPGHYEVQPWPGRVVD